MGNWTTITVAGIVATAPNILGATITPVYSCPFNDSMCQLQVSISVDTTSAHLKRIHIVNSLTGAELVPAIFRPAAGWTSPVTFTSDAFPQTRAIQNGTLTFYVENDIGNTTAGAVSVAFAVQASAVTGFASAGEVGTRYIAPSDVATRLESLTVGFVPILNGGQVPQNVYYLVSSDNGATYTGIAWQMMKTVGQQLTFARLAPGVAQTWKVAACTGAVSNVSTLITAANIASLFPGIVISAGFSVAALTVPIATLIPDSDMSVSAPTGVAPATASYPYNSKRPDGSQYWVIPYVRVVSTGAVGASNVEYLRVTAQDLDANHNPIAAEHVYDGAQVGPLAETFNFHPLMGEYGTDGGGVVRSGNIAYVRLKLYGCNRVDQTRDSFSNPLCAKAQSLVGGGLGYLDVLVASAAALPPAAGDAGQIDPTTWPHPGNITPVTATSRLVDKNQMEITWTYTKPADTYFIGALFEIEDPDQGAYAQARADGTTPWDGTYAASGDKAPLGVMQMYSPGQALVARVPALNYQRTIRLRARSFSVNVTNSTGPETTLVIPAYTAAKPNSGTAHAPNVGSISGLAGQPFTRNGVLQNAIALTLTGLPTYDPTWSGYLIVAEFANGNRVTVTGVETGAGKGIYLDSPNSVQNCTIYAVSVSIDSTNNIQQNPIVSGITPSCVVSIGTAGYTIPPVDNRPSNGGMSIQMTLQNGPTSPTGAETYGWYGLITEPTDGTEFFDHTEVTKQYDGEVEGGAFAIIPKSSLNPVPLAVGVGVMLGVVTFQNGYYPRPSYTTHITFRAYPTNKDGRRGLPVSQILELTPHSQNSLNLSQSNPSTMGPGLVIDPATGLARWATGNPATSLLQDWDFSLSQLGSIQLVDLDTTPIVTVLRTPRWYNLWFSTWKPPASLVIRTDNDAQGKYARFSSGFPVVCQNFSMAVGQKTAVAFNWRQTAQPSGGITCRVEYHDALGAICLVDTFMTILVSGATNWTTVTSVSPLTAPSNTAYGMFYIQADCTAGQVVDVGKIVLAARW